MNTPLVCYDGTDGAKRALDAAIRLSEMKKNGITVLIIAEDVDHAGELRQQVDDRFDGLPQRPNFLHIARPEPDQMCRLAQEAGADMLVMGCDSTQIAGPDRIHILEQVTCPVLLVR